MKLLVVCSSLDLRAPLGCTPSWWQLLKALAESGAELVVAPYQGPAIASPWWTAAANPCQWEGDAVALLKRLRPAASGPARSATDLAGGGLGDRLTRALALSLVRPRWLRHLRRLLETHPGTQAVLFLSVPPNQMVGVPRHLRRRFGVGVYLYDGDAPASLPRYAGFSSGFRIYPGADLPEFDGVLCNSAGAVADLRLLGARSVEVLHYAVDPALFAPLAVEEDVDVSFYGHGREYREEWIEAMVAEPSRALPSARFVAHGARLGDLGRARVTPHLTFGAMRQLACRSRVSLVITRASHARVRASSTARPFELAALGRAMVSNPYLGLDEWFEPGREILVVGGAAEAVETYRRLLDDPATRRSLGARARERLMAEHTYHHRARQLLAYLGGSPPAAATPTAAPSPA